MIERLQYHTDEEGRIVATMPTELLHGALASKGRGLREACGSRDRYVTAGRTEDGLYKVVVDPSRMGVADSTAGRHRVATAMRGLSEIEMAARAQQCSDERIQMEIATRLNDGYGHMRTSAEIQRPFLSDKTISQLGTKAMRRVALAVRLPIDLYAVGAVFTTDIGARFEVGATYNVAMETDPESYESGSAKIKLVGPHMYSPVGQLICLSGILRVATYEREQVTLADYDDLR